MPLRRSILVFAKFPEAGVAKTRLCPPLGAAEAAELAAAFLQDTCGTLHRWDGARKVVSFTPSERRREMIALVGGGFDLEPQGDGDLGARLRRAAERELAAASDVVVLLGADTPTLPPERIEAAFEALESPDVDVVLGPSVDCGYYLLGLKRVPAALFEAIEWGTPAVLPATLRALRKLELSVSVLEPWFDVDDSRDLEFLRCHLEILSLTGRGAVAPLTRRVLERLSRQTW